MRILLALDNQSYSAGIIPEVAKLAANTWADITMLGIQSTNASAGLDQALAATMLAHKSSFLAQFTGKDSPYASPAGKEVFSPDNGGWQVGAAPDSSKALNLKVRAGSAIKEIMAEADQQGCDLIILGCSNGADCQWHGETLNLPQKIAKDAGCSVLVIKEQRPTKKIISCLDQSEIQQESLELINQIVTLHDADLKIVGLTGPKGLKKKEDTEKQMAEIQKYYTDRQINAWIKLVEKEGLEAYIAKASNEGMIALWMGKKSMLGKMFSSNLIEKLVANSQSSVLILR
ncbi:MAG: universal stress protein [Desulfobulbaceae bacterium]|nr:universal stress protein [Desulfobulbaceae bacterium]HIJ78622.1 universal stress protein [Deltaproteobacteria bacterium]